MPRYRQGHRVPLNVYDGDEPIFQAHDAASAMKLVGLLNAGWRLVGITYDRLSKVFAESERYWGEEDFLERLEREVWSLLTSPETPPGSPVPEIEPVGAQDPPETAEGALSILRRLRRSNDNWEWEVGFSPSDNAPHWIRIDAVSRSWEYFEPLTDAERAVWEAAEP